MEVQIFTMWRKPDNCWRVDATVNGKHFTEGTYDESDNSLKVPRIKGNQIPKADETQVAIAEIQRILAL